MKSKEVLKILKISRVTLWKYVKSGKIRVKQEPNGYYIYNDSDVYSLAGIEDGRLNVVYARVSTQKQKQDLQNQIENCISFINAKGISVDSIYSDIKSGMSLDRKGFMELLNAVMAFKIKAVYISYKDRLARLSYELVEKLFSDYGTKIVIINQCESISLEQELFEDIMQTIHSFSMKMYSKRRIAKKLLLESKVNPALLKSLNGETDDLD
ncbi:IS607 family transposase [Helicobacter pylori]|uniref:IS607 family transposase n=3 Tax=Helicobacter pylori TaxID=210 RepID=Q6DW29_HELPX|nr:IS607 family transposase [Helicobacter pylori]EJB38597.1 putative transposase OrfA [Helicobacter pylori NQ4044]AAT72877.1 putative transposase OrfA [Helicobacter pylori]EJC51250.1 putative transposase OrfA [Helicobacter pylori Hp P-41]EJC53565.1 putative transposase OrfA [Helicobacter pylori Hp P-41]EMH25139.1 resolvase protein [Helicobacter pylori GAM260BSi]